MTDAPHLDLDAPPARRALVAGRFDPLHDGHRYVLDVAQAAADTLAVVVQTRPSDAFPAARRVAWLREAHPDADVRALDAGQPVDGAADVLVSADPAQARLAERLGARFLPVPPWGGIGSAAVRRAPLVAWAHLPPPVRADLAVRVSILGPESTGKTTLAQRLAAHYQTVCVPEYLRAWIDHKGLPVVPADVQAAAAGQVATEAALVRRCHRLLVRDTDLWMNVVYAEYYYGVAPPWLVAAARAQRRACTLVLAPDVPHVADPQREGPHVRAVILERLRARLDREGVSFHVVQGGWDARFAQARACIDPLLPPLSVHHP